MRPTKCKAPTFLCFAWFMLDSIEACKVSVLLSSHDINDHPTFSFEYPIAFIGILHLGCAQISAFLASRKRVLLNKSLGFGAWIIWYTWEF